MNNELFSEEIIKRCFNFCESLPKAPETVYQKLYNYMYNSVSNIYEHYYPRILVLQLTQNCNLRCKHCFFSEKEEKYSDKNELSDKEIMSQVKFFTEKINILHCTITGGEIFTSSKLFKVIKYLKRHNITVKLISNGTLITQDTAKSLTEILNPKYDVIQISLDGATESVNDNIRGKGVYQKVINSIQNLTQLGCNVEIGFTINSQNVYEIPDMYKLCKKYSINKLNIGRFSIQYESQKQLLPNIQDIFINIDKLAKIYQNDVLLRIPCLVVPDYLNYETGKKLLDKKLKSQYTTGCNLHCRPHHEQVTMFANGDISLCYDCTISDVIIGNILEKPFDEIWSNKKNFSIFQDRFIENHKCKKCKYITLCKAGCPYRAIQKFGNIFYPGFDCAYLKSSK